MCIDSAYLYDVRLRKSAASPWEFGYLFRFLSQPWAAPLKMRRRYVGGRFCTTGWLYQDPKYMGDFEALLHAAEIIMHHGETAW